MEARGVSSASWKKRLKTMLRDAYALQRGKDMDTMRADKTREDGLVCGEENTVRCMTASRTVAMRMGEYVGNGNERGERMTMAAVAAAQRQGS